MADELNQEPQNPLPEGDPNPGDTPPDGWFERMASVFSPVPATPAVGQGSMPESEEKTWGMFCHLTAFAAFLLPAFGQIIGPLVPWLIKREQSPFVDAQGKESLNFQITMTLFGLGTTALGFLVCFIWIVSFLLLVLFFVGVIKASMMANEGKFMAYPFTIRFIK